MLSDSSPPLRTRPVPGSRVRRSASTAPRRRQHEIRVAGFRGVFIAVYESGRRRYIYRFKNPRTGKKTSKTLGCAATMLLPELAMAVSRIQQQISLGLDPSTATMTFGDYFDREYLPHISKHLASYRDHLSRFDSHLRPLLGHVPLHQISVVRLRGVVDGVQRSPRSTGRSGPLAPATINLVIKLLQAIFTHMQERGVIDANPARHLKLCKVDNARRRILTAAEAIRLGVALQASATQVSRFILGLLLTGLREGELRCIQIADIDFATSTLTLRKTKNGYSRDLHLAPEAVAILKVQVGTRRNGFVFPSANGDGPMGYPRKAFMKILDQAGIADLRMHDLRRTWGSTAIEHPGVTVPEVSELLGHRGGSKVTLKHYLVAADDRLRTATALTGRTMSERLGLQSVTAVLEA